MGGNAIENSVRIGAEDYNNLWWDNFAMSKYCLRLIRSYRGKETFGDMDIIIPNTYGMNDPNYKRTAMEATGLTIVEEVKNSNVSSFGVLLPQGVFQIDLISLDINVIPFAYHYFAWNDCGNLIGRLARGIGLKLGHDGLWYTQREENNVLHEHLLTLDFWEALDYLDLDIETFRRGFDTMEQVFDFIMSSKYYDWNRFDLSQRNYRARVRDRKRENYKKFLQYAEGKPYNTLPPKETFLNQHFEKWPSFGQKYHEVVVTQQENNFIKSKFNGNIVSEITGLTGKELGVLMSKIKSELTRGDLLYYTQEQINNLIRMTHERMKSEGQFSS